jgi:hypothetical protein
VPEGVEIRNRGVGIFGGFGGRGTKDIDPTAPVVTIKGLALFGGVSGQAVKPKKRKNHGELGH